MPPEHLTRERNVRVAYERALQARGPQVQLLDAVRDLVRYLKQNGEPPERVIVTIKRLCGMPLVPFAGHAAVMVEPDLTRSISEAVIRVAIKEYFSRPVLDRSARI